jgi:hypothetical protein
VERRIFFFTSQEILHNGKRRKKKQILNKPKEVQFKQSAVAYSLYSSSPKIAGPVFKTRTTFLLVSVKLHSIYQPLCVDYHTSRMSSSSSVRKGVVAAQEVLDQHRVESFESVDPTTLISTSGIKHRGWTFW